MAINYLHDRLQPEMCANCPRRTFSERLVARIALGPDYAVGDCGPDLMVRDRRLKNFLFQRGIVTSPSGIVATPDFVDQLNEGAAVSPAISLRAFSAGGHVAFGVSDRICPKNVPAEYVGDFGAFYESQNRQT